jgi:hypothetical protein
MARIQIADLHSENVVELTAEEQSLIQGGGPIAKIIGLIVEAVLTLFGL